MQDKEQALFLGKPRMSSRETGMHKIATSKGLQFARQENRAEHETALGSTFLGT